MTGTVTWTTTPMPAWQVERGDLITTGGHTGTVDDVETFHTVVVVTTGRRTHRLDHRDILTVHVPDEPVDGYNLFKPRPGWSPLGCTCLSRRGDDRNWHIVATDDGCASHGNGDLYDD